ncbi:hypothetical protein [Pontiella sp.]|uniref:hypothetical protein n=1 Tax=Pontiella sp. TaxID=2837462 RepID=UPI00356921DF
MKEINPKRIVPVSTVTVVLFSLLGIFELFVLFGGLEVKASTVKRFAPWLHGPYTRMVGEHPSTRPDWEDQQLETPEAEAETAAASIGGFRPDELDVQLEAAKQAEPETKIEEPSAAIPVSIPTDQKEEPVDEDIPVG